VKIDLHLCKETYERHLHMRKEIHIAITSLSKAMHITHTRPEVYVRDLRIWKETYICAKRPTKDAYTCGKRSITLSSANLRQCTLHKECLQSTWETYLCEKRPTKETYMCEKRPIRMKRDLQRDLQTWFGLQEVLFCFTFICKSIWRNLKIRDPKKNALVFCQKRLT